MTFKSTKEDSVCISVGKIHKEKIELDKYTWNNIKKKNKNLFSRLKFTE